MEHNRYKVREAIDNILLGFKEIELPKNESKIYSDFVLNLLMKSRKNTAKIDVLTLRKNSVYVTVKRFFEIEYTVKLNYVEVLEKTNDYYILKITESGKRAYQFNCEKYKIYVPTRFKRFIIWFSKGAKVLGDFLFSTFPKGIKRFLDSAFVKFILFLIPIITLILKWDEIKDFISKHF
ncbi:hypothetical protein [Flavobacterium nitrogenifigens]|uniref:Uncharacterized protein n=1 Tax=Flavobacterium nitrogenifigens TaxID=1617283 RepID=A0A521AFC6_9FLAO|nr:hypothetical protein [Flavobacterium nitrogenifigens]KAF2331493.1 hypothetical protein DM397_12205 [Flavobacterium nitrogenifigens]SMO33525.1 hypothetical protein SAMN06265220_10191 [Flavobacterium nitrogenifigens]